MTARSLILFAAATAVLAAGLATGSPIYYMAAFGMYGVWLGALLSALLALAFMRVRMLTKGVRVQRGETAALRLTAGPGGFIPVSEWRLEIRCPLSEPETDEMSIDPPAFRRKEYRYLLSCAHRGESTVECTYLQVWDVFRLFTFRKRVRNARTELKVSPRQRDAEPLTLEPGDTGVESHARATEDAASPADVRAWQEGDSLKKVHWKLTMRKRELMVRTYEESMRPDTLILLDASALQMSRSSRLYCEDALCECALAAAQAQLMEDHPVRMPVAGSHPFELTGRSAYDHPRFAEALSGVVFDGEYPFETFLAAQSRSLQRTGAVIMITTQMNARLAEAALQMHHSRILVSYIWISDGETEEDVELLARLRMTGVLAERVNPWEDAV